jgi:putative DNA methylase
MPLDYTKSLIEEQFPVSKISKESYKERKSASNQTLTVLGKWWGRKPLILVRAVVLGCLLPVSNDKQKDKEVFLELMGMTACALIKRKNTSIPTIKIFENLSDEEQRLFFDVASGKVKWKRGCSLKEKETLQLKSFNNMSYDEKLNYCIRPEHMNDSVDINWKMINSHLETKASNYEELIEQLSLKRYEQKVRIGDCFVGGGSNIFEPSRLGCNVYGSDLNPIAGVLTWSDLNILGCSNVEKKHLMDFQDNLFDEITKTFDNLGIEKNKNGEIAKYYLYCSEIICPECGWKVPLLPTFCVNEKLNSYIKLIEDEESKSFNFIDCYNLSKNEIVELERTATIKSSFLHCPHCHKKTSINAIRGGDSSNRLRKWSENEWKPLLGDVFMERLYSIQYIRFDNEPNNDKYNIIRKNIGNIKAIVDSCRDWHTYHRTPNEEDLANEKIIINYLEENFSDWQMKGYIPNQLIESGEKTDEPIRTRGWQYWHQLFNPRQLLFLALLNKAIDELATTKNKIVLGILMLNKCADWNSKLSRWTPQTGVSQQTFYNQALNTLCNYGTRSTYSLYSIFKFDFNNFDIKSNKDILLMNAKDVYENCDIWITDPPYADAVNYEELSEFFASWDAMLIKKAFHGWYTDSKRVLAIKGVGKCFNESMVEVYTNLKNHMPDNGLQVVMFTHQDTQVWAELAMILWSAGLQVISAWCIQTETESGGLKQGNYVQGTVIMILRKHTSSSMIFKDELYEEIRDEVKSQIDTMRDIDNGDNPDFNDGDYLLAAYVAALKVLTSYKKISGIDVQYELEKARDNKGESPVTKLIETAKKEAYDYLVPSGISPTIWRELKPEERFYIKGFELELNGETKLSSFQEIARGFGINCYDDMFASKKANQVRLKTPSEFKESGLDKDAFGKTLLRHVLKAIQVAAKNESAIEGRKYLKAEYEEGNQYWTIRNRIIELLSFLGQAKNKTNMENWKIDAEYTVILREAIKNDSI